MSKSGKFTLISSTTPVEATGIRAMLQWLKYWPKAMERIIYYEATSKAGPWTQIGRDLSSYTSVCIPTTLSFNLETSLVSLKLSALREEVLLWLDLLQVPPQHGLLLLQGLHHIFLQHSQLFTQQLCQILLSLCLVARSTTFFCIFWYSIRRLVLSSSNLSQIVGSFYQP